MVTKEEYKKKFRRCILEYTSSANMNVVDEDEAEMQPADAPQDDPMGGGADMGGDPMGGGAPDMGGAPDAGGDPMGGADPNAAPGGEGGDAQPPQGFAPQGIDQNAGLDGMGGPEAGAAAPAPAPEGGAPAPEAGDDADEEVIDVDELTDTQEETEKKVEALSHKFERLMGSIDSLEKKIDDISAHNSEYLGQIANEFEKRNPTPMQRMTMRSTKSAPYGMTPDEYMNNYAPENYSAEDDNNGADDPQYKIMKSDIDNFNDYNSISREFNDKMSLRDILGF